MPTLTSRYGDLVAAVVKAHQAADDIGLDHLQAVFEAADAYTVDWERVSQTGQVHASPVELAASLEHSWLQAAGDKTIASPREHIDQMIHDAMVNGVLRRVGDDTSDGFHTFGELYRHRLLLNAVLFNLWALLAQNAGDIFNVHKSLFHHDGEPPFGGGWFIVQADLPEIGQISYHYQLQHWDLFHTVPERPRADAWDGHTSHDVALRLQRFLEDQPDPFPGLVLATPEVP